MVDTTSERGAPAGSHEQLRRYNYEHFWLGHLVADLVRTARGEGVQPGAEAPDFELESTEGARVRLSGFAGRPVLLHFGSGT
ncbi:MAG: redoxin domain-containing protein [Actinobacteria bacterium]|nr:redoxin domain-containing protein [Actinomycetota bacterium]